MIERQRRSFADLAVPLMLGWRWGPHRTVSLATKMVWLEIVSYLDSLTLGTAAVLSDGLTWHDIVVGLDIPEAEARTHIDVLIAHELLWDTGNGRLGLPQELCTTPAHEHAFVRGWRFVPTVLKGGRG